MKKISITKRLIEIYDKQGDIKTSPSLRYLLITDTIPFIFKT